jgi:alpha-tubulin suppressor-like RCC1 family protein
VITAVNGLGEGYKNSPLMVRTMSVDVEKEAGSLYVWGSNINSELGLTDEQVMQNISFYQKSTMKKIIR